MDEAYYSGNLESVLGDTCPICIPNSHQYLN
ncbi:hypothetical protein CEAHHEIO_00171 [Monkeypox virus]|uniref:Uncharacterized protein n=1 Tax=Monkeypox virus TaxID=10244 RepID=A0A650BV42_MONPV|nr:hypothetical protein PDLMKLCO_00169 [Monkeypox virus]URK21227.1 hypothetical protein MPXV-SI-2022V502225_00171 [Monkeypox virus]URK21418.1 hypothetical protein MPXV-SI-2022V52144_00171 [Monkeypox virus]URZ86253.1 hypothetical protein CEAHHEIO_00171 [Monkeypox virus]USE04224.1 hypothetical protein MPXV_SI2022_S3_00171 [Monkeypox virus]